MDALATRNILHARIKELHPDTRERLLFQLTSAIVVDRCMTVTDLHEVILKLEKSAREQGRV